MRFRHIAEHADRGAQSCHHQIHASVVVEISIRESTVRRRPGEVGPGRGAHVCKLPIPEIAKDGVRFGIAKMPGDLLDIVHHIAAGYHQVLPTVVVEIDDPV